MRDPIYHLYSKIPEQVKKCIRPSLRAFFILKHIFSQISKLSLSVFLLQGKEKQGSVNLTALFIGDTKGLLFISDLLFSGEPFKKSFGRIFVWRIKLGMKLNLPKADLVIVYMDGFMTKILQRQGFIIIPEWVLFRLDLSKKFPEDHNLLRSKNKSLRDNLREFKRHNYSYEEIHDQEKFEYFYNRMYLPYAKERYEELSFLASFRDMERLYKSGQLLLVKKGDDYVSGVLLVEKNHETLLAYSAGIIEGNIEYLKTGALTAVYYFSILWAQERGYKWMDFGHCRPLFNDGVFSYKKHWRMEIRKSDRLTNIYGFKIYNNSQGIKNFLGKNPFIFIKKERLHGFIFVYQNKPTSIKEIKAYIKKYNVPGLDCLVIVSDQGFDQEARNFASSCTTPKVQLFNSHFLQNNV